MLELRLDRVSRHYKNKIAVDQIEYSFHKGVYGLLGANGAGKTTLLRMIAGILSPTLGEISCNHMEIGRMGGEYRRMLGYLPQEFGYYPNYTVYRYMRYLAELKAVPPEIASSRILELLEQVGLKGEVRQKIKTLSGGMRRRLGIAQALLNEPEILILDEPTAGLDPKERIRFRNLISSLGRERIVILSSHIVSDIEYIADEILLMKQGKFIECGNMEHILASVKGKVWEWLVEPQEADLLNQTYVISNLKNVAGRVNVRMISCQKPDKNAMEAEPSLEDVYLYYFGQREDAV